MSKISGQEPVEGKVKVAGEVEVHSCFIDVASSSFDARAVNPIVGIRLESVKIACDTDLDGINVAGLNAVGTITLNPVISIDQQSVVVGLRGRKGDHGCREDSSGGCDKLELHFGAWVQR